MRSPTICSPAHTATIAASARSTASARPAARDVNYQVRSGDTLSSIARRFAVTVAQLQSWNQMGRSTALRAGQRLTVRANGR
jgi:membrane-bound lytic murein transglycosylase D